MAGNKKPAIQAGFWNCLNYLHTKHPSKELRFLLFDDWFNCDNNIFHVRFDYKHKCDICKLFVIILIFEFVLIFQISGSQDTFDQTGNIGFTEQV